MLYGCWTTAKYGTHMGSSSRDVEIPCMTTSADRDRTRKATSEAKESRRPSKYSGVAETQAARKAYSTVVPYSMR